MTTDTLSSTFAALADPTRRAILARLMQGEASVSELAVPFEMTTRAISKHVAVLERAGLITRGKDAQRRPSRLRVEPLADIDGWLRDYRHMWEQRFEKLGAHLERAQKGKRR